MNLSSKAQNQNPKAPGYESAKSAKSIALQCCNPLKLLGQNTTSPGRALIPNGQGTEGIIAKLQRVILGMGEIWGLEKKNTFEKSDDMGFKKCT